MHLKIHAPLSKQVCDVQSSFDVGDFKHPEKRVFKEIEDHTSQNKLVDGEHAPVDRKVSSDEVYVDEDGVYQYVVPHCSHCRSKNVTKHDSNLTPVYLEDGKKVYVRVKKYNCKSCGKGSQVEFTGEFKKFSGLPEKLDTIIEKINSLHWISLRDIQKIIKITLGITISHEFIRKAELITDKLYWCDENFTSANYVNYDCQWVPVDSGWIYLHVAINTKTKKIIAVELTEDEEKGTLRKFFKKTFKINPKVIITDGKPGYHELIKDEMGIEHQECIIHFRKSVTRKINKELGTIKNRIKGSLLNENPEIKETELKEKTEKLMKPIEKEYWSYKDDVMKSFEFETYEESSNYIQNLRKKAQNFPKAICTYLTNNFFNIYRRLILYKHEDYKDKIPSNNNLSETKIGWCASKSEKRKYRTDLGFFNHIVSRIKHWG